MLIRNALIHLVALTLFGLSGLMGIFAAAGLCAAFWGSQVLDTALANPPDRTQPAFWVFMLAMVPAMLVGFVGGIFTFVVPLYAFFDVRVFRAGPNYKQTFALYIRLLQQIHARNWPDSPPVDQGTPILLDQTLQRNADRRAGES